MSFARRTLFILVVGTSGLHLLGQHVALGGAIANIVALGDSLFDDTNGDRSPVVPEILAQRLDRPLTNLARSGSTSADLIRQGQHTSAALQFGAGDLALLWIGGNDIFAASLGIAFGLDAELDRMADNVAAILSTLKLSDLDVLVFNLPDMSRVPVISALAPAQLLPNFRDVSLDWRDRLAALAQEHGAHVVDVVDLIDEVEANPDDFDIFGRPLVTPPETGCSLCWFADPIHPSSLAQGYLANQAIQVLTEAGIVGDAELPLLSELELSLLAGLLVADNNANGEVDAPDYTIWRDTFLSRTDLRGDVNGNGIVDVPDYVLWRDSFGRAVGVDVAVPEPASSLLLVWLSCCTLLAPRRRDRFASCHGHDRR